MSDERTEEEWRQILTPEQYAILREKGTERAFSGALWNHEGDGVYACAGCGTVLFDSRAKYESGSGWPSFWGPVAEGRIRLDEDGSLGMRRIEAVCAHCGGHLGHVFPDGPQPTGERYCINSASLEFEER